MKTFTTKTMLLAIGAMFVMTSAASANEHNQKTVITFSGPVEIPGKILPAGTYVFKIADSPSSRNIIQIFSQDERTVYSTILAIPDYRHSPAEKTIINFGERPAGSPPAVRGWFYPGRTYGHEFVYPKSRAVTLAQANHVAVPGMPEELVADTSGGSDTQVAELNDAPLKAEEPNGTEVELAFAFPLAAPPALGSHPTLPTELPETASDLPLIGLIGMSLLAAAAGVRLAAARAKK